MNLKIIFFGTPEFVIPVLSSLEKSFSVVGVVTAPDKKVGRKQILTPSAVKNAYKGNGHIITEEKFTSEVIGKIASLSPDLFVVAAYGKIIPKSVLDIPTYGAINIHPSDLPKYRGASPIQASILAGETESAVTIIKMDEEVDHGPILKKIPFTISADDTFSSVADASFRLAADNLSTIIDDFISGITQPVEQEHEKATFCGIIEKNDGFIDSNNPPSIEQIDRMVRAYYPWPVVWIMLPIAGKEQRVKLHPNNMLQVEGKNRITVKDFLNGYPELKDVVEKLLKG
jgi:methionyl-tRNA formyltransferase